MKRSIRNSYFLGVVILVVIFALVLLVGIKVPLTLFKSQIELAAGELIQRQVTIDGGLYLSLSLKPAIEIQDMKIANPADWPDYMPMFYAHNGTAQVDALSLISGNIRVMYFRMREVNLNLVTREDHSVNYHFESTDQSDTTENADQKMSSLRLASIDEVHLEDITIVYHDMLSGNSYDFSIDEAYGTARETEPLKLSVGGQLVGQPLSIDISGDELAKLVQLEDYWSLNSGTLTLADTSVSLNGNVGKEPGSVSGYIDLSLAGSGLAELGRSFGVSLPDPGEFTLEIRMSASPASIQASNIILESRPLKVRSELLLSLHGDRPALMGEISVEHFDLDLIDMPQDESNQENPDKTTPQRSNILDQEIPLDFLRVIDTDLRLKAGELPVGNVVLNEINAIVSLVDGDLIVPLHADVMGVVIDTRIGVQANPEVSTLSLSGALKDADLTSLLAAMKASDGMTAEIGRLDYEVVPESDIKGLMNIRIDLSAAADDPGSLQGHANGKVRLGIIPEHMESGVVDLWAVNILTAALPAIMEGSESEINCLAADFTFDDGIITPEVFLLDTSRMRVQGEGFVNLKDEAIDFSLNPTPKSPQFFSMATPVDITGTIRDFNIGVSAGSVIGTVFRLVSGVVTVPLQTLFSEDMAADGVEACSAAMAWVLE